MTPEIFRNGLFGLAFYLTTKFWRWPKLKAFADDKLNIAKMTISFFNRIENTVGKGENAGYQHFLLFPHCFPNSFSLRPSKVGILW